MSAFGAALVRIRQAAGFPTAYAFYHGRDGRRTLGLTFRNYVNIEKGKNVPKPERLEAILLALGYEQHRDEARELVAAYLSSLGLDRIKRFMPDGAGARPDLHALAARSAVQKAAIQLTLQQWQLLAGDFEVHSVATLLANTRGGMETARIAKTTGLKLPVVKRALKALEAAKLVKLSGEKARSLVDDKATQRPPKSPAMLAAKAQMAKQFQRWAESGKSEGNYLVTVRLTRAHLDQFKQQVGYLQDLAELLSNSEETPDSSVYMMQTRVVDMFPAKD